MTQDTPGRVYPDKPITRRQWLLRRAIMAGASPMLAQEAVASTALEHEDWDMDEEKTWAEWEIAS